MSRLEEVLPQLRQGKKIRRIGWNEFAFLQPNINITSNYSINLTDIRSEDWEVVEEKLLVTRDMLARAWDRSRLAPPGGATGSDYFNSLCRELGFGEESK